MKRQGRGQQKRIAVRTVCFTVIGSIVLGVATLLAGLLIYRDFLQQVYTSRAGNTAIRAATATQKGVDIFGYAKDVMAVYDGLSQEQRSGTGTEGYRDGFRSLGSVDSPDGTHRRLTNLLDNYRTDVSAITVCALDRENSALVCLASTSGADSPAPGDWSSIPAEWAEQIAAKTDPDGNTLGFSRDTKEAGREYLAVYPVPDEGEGADRGSTGHAVCVVAKLPFSSLTEKVVSYAVKVSAVALAITLLFSLLAGWYMKRTVAGPVNAIADTAMAYVQDKRNGVARSDHFSSIGVHTGDELENLTCVMADMEQDLTEYEEELKRATAEKQSIRTELDLASRIQSSALPGEFPPFPDRKEFELFASMDPAREVGGDFYDFFLIDDDNLALVIADVSGKGVPAALFMMVSKSLIKNQLLSGCDPAQALANTNNQLSDGNTSSAFVTVWLAVLQLSTGKGLACNAGHENPCLHRGGAAYEVLKYKHSQFVGAIEGMVYKNREFELLPGDSVFVYTDGVPEAKDAADEMFGEARLLEVLNRDPSAPPEELVGRMKRAIDDFVKDAPQFDDITMLAFRYNGPQGKG